MKFEDGDEFLTRLRVTFYALLAGPLLIFFFLLLQENQGSLDSYISIPKSAYIIRGIAASILISITVIAYVAYNRNLIKVREQGNLRGKLQYYWQENLRKYLLLESACVLALLAHFITLDPIFKGLYVLSMVAMAISNPSLYSILKDLRANKEEAVILKKNLPIS